MPDSMHPESALTTHLGTGYEVLNWLVSITSASFFTNWAVIGLTSFRFRAAVKAQGLTLFAEPFAWSSKWWPLAPILVLAVSLLLLVCLLICACAPIGADITAANFFTYTIGLLVIGSSMIGYKIVYKTKWVSAAHADLTTGRHHLTEDEISRLKAYYDAPMWRRILSHLSLS